MGAGIKVIGLGDAGCLMAGGLVSRGIPGIKIIAMNTNGQCLQSLNVPDKVHASEVSRDQLVEIAGCADLVFVVVGLGGASGSTLAPAIAFAAKETGTLTIVIATLPFSFEGQSRQDKAENDLAGLAAAADTLIVIPSDCAGNDYATIDQIIYNLVEAIVGPLVAAKIDIIDLLSIFEDEGLCLVGIGPAEKAIASPLLCGAPLTVAEKILAVACGPDDKERDAALSVVIREISRYAALVRSKLDNEGPSKVVLFATGFRKSGGAKLAPDDIKKVIKSGGKFPFGFSKASHPVIGVAKYGPL